MVSCHEMMISCHEMMVSWHEMTFLMYGGPTLYKIGLAISVPVLPISANVCNLCLKRLHPLPQTFAIFAANVCGEKMPFVESLSPHVFLLSRSVRWEGCDE